MQRTDHGIDLQLLLSGYVREHENVLQLYMNVPDGIVQIMHNLYPILLFTFGDFNKERFILSDDNTILKGNNNSCDGYMIYADLGKNNDIGLKEGVHFWTIKSLFCHEKDAWNEFADCYCSIGVTTEKNKEIINENQGGVEVGNNEYVTWIFERGINSYLDISYHHNDAITITIKLDCNEWKVTYYANTEKVKQDQIEPNKYYYLAMYCCDQLSSTQLIVIDTPDKIIENKLQRLMH